MKKLFALILTLVMALTTSALADMIVELGEGVVSLTSDKETTYVISCGEDQFHFTAPAGETVVLPLRDGAGTYSVKECVHRGGHLYEEMSSRKIRYAGDELAPFTCASSVIPYTETSLAVKKAAELVEDVEGDIAKVKAIYAFIKANFIYDYVKAAKVKNTSRYVVNVDETFTSRQGVCYDLAALMVAMIRSIGIPAKMEIGASHAWVSVYVDGKWSLIDPAARLQTGKAKYANFAYEAEEVF